MHWGASLRSIGSPQELRNMPGLFTVHRDRLKDSSRMTTHQSSLSLCNLRVSQTLTKEPAPTRVMEAQSCTLSFHRDTSMAYLLGRKSKFQLHAILKTQQNRCSIQRRDRCWGAVGPQNTVFLICKGIRERVGHWRPMPLYLSGHCSLPCSYQLME